jgi:prepilin-type N-terminal cleavage/methylation domain-containing protein
MLQLNVRKYIKGFTLIETLIVVMIIGIASAIAVPNFLNSYEKFKLDQAVVEVRGALREAQRQAIRKGESCQVMVDMETYKMSAPCLGIADRALADGIEIATNIVDVTATIAQNIDSESLNANRLETDSYLVASTEIPSLSNLGLSPSNRGNLLASGNSGSGKSNGGFCGGNNSKNDKPECFRKIPVKFGVLGTAQFTVANPTNTANPTDPSGKIVFYISGKSESSKKCIAISNTLGLTRAGVYNGSLAPDEITGYGVCTAS